jgi:hypothetical protein
MLLKTKDRCEKLSGLAGMYMKIREISAESGNVGENKGGRWHVLGRWWGTKKRGWRLGACPPPARASITRSVSPAGQESPTNPEKEFFFDGTMRECP